MSSRLYGNPRECPVLVLVEEARAATPCGSTVRAGAFMCPRHWKGVPKDVRSAVRRTWAAWQAHGSADHWSAFSDAREAALTTVGV